jgi:hypothetical protein
MHFNTVEEAREGLDLDDEIVVFLPNRPTAGS